MKKLFLLTLFLAAACGKGDGPDPGPDPGPGTGGGEEMIDVILFKVSGNILVGEEEVGFDRIIAMTPDASRKAVLHDGSAFQMAYAEACRAALDPTGTKLILQGGDYYLWEYDLVTKQHRTVLAQTEGICVDEPVYSPDGGKILFCNWDSSSDRLEAISPAGTGHTPVTAANSSLGRQNYTPGGQKIVAAEWIPWTYLYVCNPDGSQGDRIITAPAGQSVDCPYPVSDTRIVYVHYTGAEKSGVCSIRSCNIDGTGGATLETLGAFTVDYLTANADATMIGYYKMPNGEGANSYVVRQLGASTLGGTISTSSDGGRYRFGRIKKEIFDAAPDF